MSQYPQQSPEEEDTFRSENVKILHCLQLSLAKVSGLLTSQLSPLHQIFICGTTVLPQLRHFWDTLQTKIALESPNTNVGSMRLRLSELQENDEETKLLRGSAGLSEGWEDVEGVL